MEPTSTHHRYKPMSSALKMYGDFKLSASTECTIPGFHAGVAVWIRRPNVVDRKVLGAVVSLTGTLTPGWRRQLVECTLATATIRELGARWDEGKESCSSDHAQKFVVRALLPRRRQFQGSHELVVTG